MNERVSLVCKYTLHTVVSCRVYKFFELETIAFVIY